MNTANLESGWLLLALDEAKKGRSDKQRRAIFAKMGKGKSEDAVPRTAKERQYKRFMDKYK